MPTCKVIKVLFVKLRELVYNYRYVVATVTYCTAVAYGFSYVAGAQLMHVIWIIWRRDRIF